MPAEEQADHLLQTGRPPIVVELQPGVELDYDHHQLLRIRPFPLALNAPNYDRLIEIVKFVLRLDTAGLSYEHCVEVVRRLRAIFNEGPAPPVAQPPVAQPPAAQPPAAQPPAAQPPAAQPPAAQPPAAQPPAAQPPVAQPPVAAAPAPPAAQQPAAPLDSLERDIHYWQLLNRKLSVIRGGFTCLAYFGAVYVVSRVLTAPSELFHELMIGAWCGLAGVLGVLLGLLLKSPSEEQLQVAGREVAYKVGLIQALLGGLLGVVLGSTVSYFHAIPSTAVEPMVVPSAQSSAASQAAQTLVRQLVLSVTMTMAIIFGFLVSIKADLLIIPERPTK